MHRVADGLKPRFPATSELLTTARGCARPHALPPRTPPAAHSTNPLERLHKEIKRRTNVIGIFPNRASLLRLVGMLIAEQNGEWAVADRRYFSAESMRHIGDQGGDIAQELVAAIAGSARRGVADLHHFTGHDPGRMRFPTIRTKSRTSGLR